jgi:hypothetical protein
VTDKERGIASVLVLVIALGVFVFIQRDRSGPELDPPAVVAQIRQLNHLATVKYTVQKVVGLKERKQPVGEESILLILQASVEAGIDLGSMRPEDVTRRADGALVLRLPPPKLLNVAVDEKETKVWDREKTWWTPWVPYSLDLEQRARQTGLEAVKQAALDMGILRQAERNAEESIRGLLGLAGVKSVVVIPASAS